MSTSKHFDKICIIVIIIAMLGTIFFMNGEAFGLTRVVDADAEANSDSVYFTDNDQDAGWSTDKATSIVLEGEDISVSGQGAYAYDGSVYIRNAGKYVVSGTLSDGSIVIDAEDASKVWILLNGVEIFCSDDACIRVDQADKVFLTLAEGTENLLSSGEDYSEEALADGTGGVIYAHDDLTINGSGSLTITGTYKHGIEANDDLVITGGMITIDAAGDGIHVNDSLRMKDVGLTITAVDEGIDIDGASQNGYLYIESGTYRIVSEGDGIHAAGDITAAGGDIVIRSGDDGIHSETAAAVLDGTILIEECYEGIEAKTINIAGGDVTIYTEDDGINANGNSDMQTGNGNPAGDMHGFGDRMQGRMSEGNPPGGENGEMPEMPPGGENGEMPEMPQWEENGEMPEMPQQEETAMEDTWIRISGGSVTIINEDGRDADGLDSNGDIYITGGEVRISMEGTDGSNSAIDYASESGGVLEVTGGTIAACGGSSMAEGFDAGSAQVGILYNLESSAEAGTEVQIVNEDGEILLAYTAECAFNSVALSCPELEVGKTYTIMVGDTAEEIIADSTAVITGTVGMGGPQFGNMDSLGGGKHRFMIQ